jgi:ComF family protein
MVSTASAGPIRDWLRVSLGLVYPEVCQLCRVRRAAADEGLVCAPCRQQVRFIRSPLCQRCGLPFDGALTTEFQCANCREMDLRFSSARAAVVARSVVLEVIHRFKYSRALWFEPFLADLLLGAAVPALRPGGWDFIVPVPLHPLKRREREFNQAELLGRHLGRALNLPVKSRILRRIQPTATQTLLTREQRAANMQGAFAVRPGVSLAGQKIVLVDDVFTTGATANACARALRTAGAVDVCVWTVARGL